MFENYLANNNKYIRFYSRFVLFIITFSLSLSIFYLLFSQIDFVKPYTSVLANAFEKQYVITRNDAGTGFLIFSEPINILDVCTGWFELAVFISLILATIDRTIINRLVGILILIPLFLVFNFSRIYLVVDAIVKINYEYVEIIHTILFKVGLFLFFCIFYYLWLKLSEGN